MAGMVKACGQAIGFFENVGPKLDTAATVVGGACGAIGGFRWMRLRQQEESGISVPASPERRISSYAASYFLSAACGAAGAALGRFSWRVMAWNASIFLAMSAADRFDQKYFKPKHSKAIT